MSCWSCSSVNVICSTVAPPPPDTGPPPPPELPPAANDDPCDDGTTCDELAATPRGCPAAQTDHSHSSTALSQDHHLHEQQQQQQPAVCSSRQWHNRTLSTDCSAVAAVYWDHSVNKFSESTPVRSACDCPDNKYSPLYLQHDSSGTIKHYSKNRIA